MELLCVLAAVAALFCGCTVLTLKCRVPASVAPLTALSLIVAVLTLLLTFLCGMVVMRSFVGVLLSAISTLTGVSLASDAASMNQGISYIAGRIAPSVGGAAVLCQLIGMAVPALVFLVYLCGVAKVHFSWELLLGFVGVTTLPTAAVALLAMVLSLLSPWLALLVALCGMAVSYTQACGLLSAVTGRPDAQLLPVKMLLVALALALTIPAALPASAAAFSSRAGGVVFHLYFIIYCHFLFSYVGYARPHRVLTAHRY